MAKAFVSDSSGNKVILAESEETIRIEGNHYFPPDSVKKEYFSESDAHTICHWKGEASYKDVTVEDKVYKDGSWYYPEPKDGSVERVGKDYSNYFAFWRGVEVED